MARRRGGEARSPVPGAVWLLLALAVLGALPALAQTDAAVTPETTGGESADLFSARWFSTAALYVGVTVVCVAVFSLIFLKCWYDVSQSLAEHGLEPVEPAEPSTEEPGPSETDG